MFIFLLTFEQMFGIIQIVRLKETIKVKQINGLQLLELIYSCRLYPGEECWIVDQDSGDKTAADSFQVLRQLDTLKEPVFMTDDDGIIRIVTLDIYHGMRGDDRDTGSVIRIFLYRKAGQKRIQPVMLSNGVGAPTSGQDCIQALY